MASDAYERACNADLRLTPQAPEQYRVVLTCQHGDGQLCQMALTPLEASVLVSEIVQALEDGDRQASRSELEQTP